MLIPRVWDSGTYRIVYLSLTQLEKWDIVYQSVHDKCIPSLFVEKFLIFPTSPTFHLLQNGRVGCNIKCGPLKATWS